MPVRLATASVDNTEALRLHFASMVLAAPAEVQEVKKKHRWDSDSSLKKPTPEPVDLSFRPLSSFPLSAPSAPVEGLTVDAGPGSDISKGLASLLAIVKFMGTAQEMLEAQQASGKTLTSKLASALSFYQLRDYTTWCFSSSGRVQSDQRVLTDFCPGHFLRGYRDVTTGMLSTPLQMARSLDLPSNFRVL